jgi:hypothetical protein
MAGVVFASNKNAEQVTWISLLQIYQSDDSLGFVVRKKLLTRLGNRV